MKPELLQMKLNNGSTFIASDSFVRKWMCEVLDWSHQKATCAANKLPNNWEDICKKSFFCKAYGIKEEDILAELFVNSDQTHVVFAPGDKMTWTEKGAKQVSLVGGDEKCAFTALISVACSGTLLPIQEIYSGKMQRSCPSPKSLNHQDLLDASFTLEASGTSTYWSNQSTMRTFVEDILDPYLSCKKAQLGLPPSQKSMWSIDVWLVH